jgi:hypothetical protein
MGQITGPLFAKSLIEHAPATPPLLPNKSMIYVDCRSPPLPRRPSISGRRRRTRQYACGRMMIRDRMVEQIEVEESAGNEETAAHLRIVLDRPAHATPPQPPEIAASPADPQMIKHYHAHIYYDPVLTRDSPALLRERVAAAFPAATLGSWHDAPVGPHPNRCIKLPFRLNCWPRSSRG